MAGDILNHRPARPETVFPGHWHIHHRQTWTINIKRFRDKQTTSTVVAGSVSEYDPMEAAWRAFNSHVYSGEGGIKEILRDGCAVVVAGSSGRELWHFVSHEEDPKGPFEVSDLKGMHSSISAQEVKCGKCAHTESEMLPDTGPLDVKQLLNCPRHGHDLSCLSRPSTSQRPLKSCDVRFEPQGDEKGIWEKLGQAIYERAEWARGKRVMASRISRLDIKLFPEPNGLLLVLRPSSPAPHISAPMRTGYLATILPLGFRGAVIAPYQPTSAEAPSLASSFELALGSGWKDEQKTHRLKAQLANKAYHEYTTLWIPDPLSIQSQGLDTDTTDAEEWRNKKGVLAVWPTHLIAYERPIRAEPPSTRQVAHIPTDTHLDLMSFATGLFEAASNHREPVQELTPPGDTALEIDQIRMPHNALISPSASSEIGTEPVQNGHGDGDGDGNGNDDLEDLFGSRPGSPGTDAAADDSDGHFEMFGEDDVQDQTVMNNAHLIDYDDVVMASPPRGFEPERRESVREVMGDADGGDEAGIANVTEDDFNFFDSPAAVDVQTPIEISSKPEKQLAETRLEQVTKANKVIEPELVIESSGVQDPKSPSPINSPPGHIEPASTSPSRSANPEVVSLQSEHPTLHPTDAHAALQVRFSADDAVRHDSLVPDTFAPLALDSGTTFKYSLPSPAPTPPGMNDDLISRLRNGTDAPKSYDYSSAWRLGTPESETEVEEYTGPPSPISEAGGFETITERQPAKDQVRQATHDTGQLEYDGIACIGARLVALVSKAAWAEESLVAWKTSWEQDQHRPSQRNLSFSSPVALVSRKRKRSETATPDISELNDLAKQTISNQAFRLLLRTQSRSGPNESVLPEDDLVRRGAPLLPETTLRDWEAEQGQHDSMSGSLAPCAIHTGYHNRLVQISIAALRFWPELGLQPLSGPKDIKATIIVETAEDRPAARHLAEKLGDSYASLQLGTIEWSKDCGSEGIINYDRMKGTLPLLKWLNDHGGNGVIFFMLRSSSIFPDIQSMLGEAFRSKLSQNQIIHYLPLFTELRDMPSVAKNVYDRLPRQLRVVDSEDDQAPWYDYPSFTLAPPEPAKAHLTLQWPLKSYDVFGTWRWIHAAYALDQASGSIVVFVADAQGDNWDTQAIQNIDMAWDERIKTVWDYVTAFAEAASIEWRASVSSLGYTDPAEAKAWQDLFVTRTEPMSIIVCDAGSTSGEIARPRPIPPNVPPGIIGDISTSIIDDSLSATYCTMATRQSVSCGTETFYSDTSFLLSLMSSSLDYHTSTYHVIGHRPPPGREEEATEKELANELYRSASWARMKFGMERLPAALAAVRTIGEVFREVCSSED